MGLAQMIQTSAKNGIKRSTRRRPASETKRRKSVCKRMRRGSSRVRIYVVLPSLRTHGQVGKKPRKGKRDDLPKPTELMKRREGSLELEKNLNKTMVVQNAGTRGPGVPGFYCETCNRTYKDSIGYLDHLNGRARTSSPFASVEIR